MTSTFEAHVLEQDRLLCEEHVNAAIQPQLDALERLFHRFSPRQIGKHHPEYKTGGRHAHPDFSS